MDSYVGIDSYVLQNFTRRSSSARSQVPTGIAEKYLQYDTEDPHLAS